MLNINNIRDIESDKMAGKFSIPVRIGKQSASHYHWFLLIAGIACSVMYVLLNFKSAIQFIFLVTLPLFLINAIAVNSKPSEELDPYLKQMAISTLLFVILFGSGLMLA